MTSPVAAAKLWMHRRQVAAVRGGDLTPFPVTVHIGPMAGCNQDCVWCSDLDYRKKYPGYLDGERFSPILAEMAEGGVQSVVWIGSGEPTLHPKFVTLVEQAARVGLRQGLVTNGVRLPLAQLAHFSWVRVSLDAGARETYLRLHQSDDFPQVMDNLRAAQERGACELGVSFLGCPENEGELPVLAEMLDAFGVDYLQVKQPTSTLRYKGRPLAMRSQRSVHPYRHLRVLEDVTEQEGGNAGLPCWASSLNTVVGPTGDVFLCCRLVNMGREEDAWLGNLYGGFRAVWEGTRRKEVVARFLQTEETKRCPTCWMTRFNREMARGEVEVPESLDHSPHMWFI